MLSSAAKQTSISPETGGSPDDLLRAIIDACVSNVAVLDESGAIIYASKAWNPMEPRSEPLADPHDKSLLYFENFESFSRSDLGEEPPITLANDLAEILSGKIKEFHRRYYSRLLTERRPFVIHAARLNLPPATLRVLITHEELPLAEEEFRTSKKRLLELLGTMILAWEGEVEGQRFTYVSEQAGELLGYPEASWYEPGFLASHVHADDLQVVLAAFQKQTQVMDHFDLTFRLWASNGQLVWVQNLISVSRTQGRTRLHGFIIDVSERKRVELALKDLAGRLIAAQEEERRRVARELHDDLNQRMALLSLELEQLGEKIEQPRVLRKTVQLLLAQANELSTEIHRLSYRLHPSKLDHLGLLAAVKSLCRELTQSGKIKVEFHHTGFPGQLDKDLTLCVFRIAQEGLRNCVKHSGADSVTVLLTKTRSTVRLVVSDNGCGFNTKSELMERGLGFTSMKERLHVLGGEISVYSQPQTGTRVDVLVPLRLKTTPP
jgi:PAS domain S-box-containing protein